MSKIYEQAFFDDGLMPFDEVNVSVASSAVLYGLSVYTVFPVLVLASGKKAAFRIHKHYRRLINSARIIGIDTFEPAWSEERFVKAVEELVAANDITQTVFVRATVHVTELVAGTRSRGLETKLSMFIYEALPILPQDGARLKTTVWRRIPDYAIPSRAKVNGAYVNSVLAKQDAIDSGYDDCIFLDVNGHVCELSAANIFIVRNGVLITPDTTSDILEGINRQTVFEIAAEMGIKVVERSIDLTELYVADEVFACGTSSFIAPIIEVDARKVADGRTGPITQSLRTAFDGIMDGSNKTYKNLLTVLE